MDITYFIIIFIVVIAVIIVSYVTYKNINNWYFTNSVNRPPQSPSPLIFGIVWFILYAIYAYVWCESYKITNIKPILNLIFIISLIINVLWVISFFGFHEVNFSKIIIILLLIIVLFQAYMMWTLDSGLLTFLMLIYASWLIVATGLNFNTTLI